MKRVCLNFLLVTVALVGSLSAAEALFRVFFCEPIGLFRQVAAIGYVMVPNYQGCHRKWGGFDIRIVTNELGYRDAPLDHSKRGARVLALGDSVTFGGVKRSSPILGSWRISCGNDLGPRPLM